MRSLLFAALALALALTGACGKSSPRKHHVPMDAEAARVPIDAPRIHTAAERVDFFNAIPTDKAIAVTIKRIAIAPHPAGSPENEAAGHEILATLGRLGVRTGVAEEQVLMPSFEGPMLVLELKPRPIRNLLAIFEGDVQDAIVVGATFDSTDTTVASHAQTAALLEIARGYAALQRAGWHPHRTIILAFWDGGTIGDQGVTAWVEEQHQMLSTNAIAYIDLGPLGGGQAPLEVDSLLRSAMKSTFDDLDGGLFATESTAPAAPAVREGIPTARWVTTAELQPDDAIISAAAHVARRAGRFAMTLADAPTTPIDYEWIAGAAGGDISNQGFAPVDWQSLMAGATALRAIAPDLTKAVTPECDRAIVGALRAFMVDDGNPSAPWSRNVRMGVRSGTPRLEPYPEVAAAVRAKDPAALHRAAVRLTTAFQRATTILAPCATTTSP